MLSVEATPVSPDPSPENEDAVMIPELLICERFYSINSNARRSRNPVEVPVTLPVNEVASNGLLDTNFVPE